MSKGLRGGVPRVSVVLSTFNRCEVLRDTIASILSQNYPNLEVIIVNDGSSDDTRGVLEQFQSDPRFCIVTNNKNKGLQASLNIGIRHATGKYIARIDDHDLWVDPDKLTKQIRYLERHPKTGLLGTGFQAGGRAYKNRLSDKAIRRQMLFRCPFCHVSVVFPKNVWEELGGYNEKLKYGEDWELWLRIGQRYQLANLPDITVKQDVAMDGLSKKYQAKQLRTIKAITKKYRKGYSFYFLSVVYHRLVSAFFWVFPSNGFLQKKMHLVFRALFLESSNGR